MDYSVRCSGKSRLRVDDNGGFTEEAVKPEP
jgi:hypothetical protein